MARLEDAVVDAAAGRISFWDGSHLRGDCADRRGTYPALWPRRLHLLGKWLENYQRSKAACGFFEPLGADWLSGFGIRPDDIASLSERDWLWKRDSGARCR